VEKLNYGPRKHSQHGSRTEQFTITSACYELQHRSAFVKTHEYANKVNTSGSHPFLPMAHVIASEILIASNVVICKCYDLKS